MDDVVAAVDDTSIRGDDAETENDTISEDDTISGEIDVDTEKIVVITDEEADEDGVTFTDGDDAGGEATVEEGERVDIETDCKSGPLPLPLPLPLPKPVSMTTLVCADAETEEEDGVGATNSEDDKDVVSNGDDVTLDTDIDKTSDEDIKQSHNTNCSFGIFNYRKGQST